MRLTLRTLLAYMDDILEPVDHEDLGKKIEASDFATELIHRSRDAVRRLRLGAPAVNAGGVSDDVLGAVSVADANSVAEYLDNTLPTEDVAEFERLCLESSGDADMHLAEVVSCHHVLTMVLGEPAEIDNKLKQRIYRLPTDVDNGKKLRIESAHVLHQAGVTDQAGPTPTAVAAPQPTAVETPVATRRAELPDYLRAASASRGRTKRMVLTAAAAAFVGFVGWWVYPSLFPSELPSHVAQFEGEVVVIEEIEEIVLPNATDTTVSSGGDAPAFDPGALASVPGSAAPSAETGKEEDAPVFVAEPLAGELDSGQLPIAEPAGRVEQELEIPITEEPNDGVEAGPTKFESGDLELGAAESDPTSSVAGASASVAAKLGTVRPAGQVDSELGIAPAGTDLADGSPAEEGATGAVPEEATSPAGPALEPEGPVQLGNYLGNNDVLLWLDREENEWVRLPPRSALSTGASLLTLPKFRTHVVLADMNLYLSGGTQIKLPNSESKLGSNAAELELAVSYGRVLLTAGLKGNQLAIQIGDEVREFQLESSASLAVEVRRVFVPQGDFDEQSPVEALWYLTSGRVVWPSAAGEEQTIEAPAVWKTAERIDGLPENIAELPKWIDREQMTPSESRAHDTLAEELTAGEPVALRLLELTDEKGLGRRREVRTLAAEASVYVGVFEPSVNALNDSAQSRTWDIQIEVLRQAMARSPQVAAQVREAFSSLRGEAAAADLMELLAGYSAQTIGETREERRGGALAKLIGWLENDSLDYRVLAIHNLNEITGTSYLEGYRPSGPIQRRKISVKKLEDRLESGDLLPVS